jgi:IS30 family transposase
MQQNLFYPKGTDFNEVSDDDIAGLDHILNVRGRKSLGYRSPNEVYKITYWLHIN